METLSILRFWAACAWADDSLHPTEAAALRRLIEASEDLTDGEAAEARGYLETPPAVSLDEVQELSPEAREGVYRAARGIMRLDHEVAPEELSFLGRLRERLALPAELLRRIEAEVPLGTDPLGDP